MKVKSSFFRLLNLILLLAICSCSLGATEESFSFVKGHADTIRDSPNNESFDSAISLNILGETEIIDGFPDITECGIDCIGDFSNPEDWDVDSETWMQEKALEGGYNERAIISQFRADVKIWYHTLFDVAKSVGGKRLKEKHLRKLEKVQNFLKRWFLTLAFIPLRCVTKDNASVKSKDHPDYQQMVDFPYPLASALSHGQRTVFKSQGITEKMLYNLLLSGNYKKSPDIDYIRSFSSHGVSEEGEGLQEDKLRFGVLNTLKGSNRGVDIPLGGVGNQNEMGHFIGPEGQSYGRFSPKHRGKYQLGHVCITIGRFNGFAGVLMGVESAAPRKVTPFREGRKHHTWQSGMKDETKDRSCTGGQKWQALLGDKAPAHYGGLIIQINANKFSKLQELFEIILNKSQEEQEEIFKELLRRNATEAQAYLKQLPDLGHLFEGMSKTPSRAFLLEE